MPTTTLTSLNIHSGCREALVGEENASGYFWDKGIRTRQYLGGDYWSMGSNEDLVCGARPASSPAGLSTLWSIADGARSEEYA